jgi:spore coat polysaccharide biosynthesis protein SpsF
MIGIIIQARTGSTRFARKIYEDINGKNTLQRVIEGTNKSELAHKIILAMPRYDEDEFRKRQNDPDSCIGSRFADVNRFETYFGDPDDLVDRYFNAARLHSVDLIVRVTADCPLVQGKIIDEMLIEYLKKGYNGFMGCNELVSPLPYPDGVDVEIFPFWMLAETRQLTQDPVHREHVTPFMYRRGTEYNIHSFLNCRPNTMISMRFKDFSFDTPEDLTNIKHIVTEYDKHGDLDKAIKECKFEMMK